MNFRIVGIDDSQIELLKTERVIKSLDESIIFHSFDNAKLGLSYCINQRPDIVLVDIEMGHYNGLDLCLELSKRNILSVVLSSYTEYALDSYNYNILHYVVKPLSLPALQEILHRVEKWKSKGLSANHHSLLFDNKSGFTDGTLHNEMILINTSDDISFIHISDIVYLKAKNNYTQILTQDKNLYLSSKTLKYYSTLLSKFSDFRRVHKSYIANRNFIKKIHKRNSEFFAAELSFEENIELFVVDKEEFFRWLLKIG